MRIRGVVAGVLACLTGAAAFAGAPNLRITALSGPGTAVPGETISVFVEVSEVRGEDARTTFRVGIYFSASGAVDPVTDTALDSWYVSDGLFADTSASTTLPVDLPAGMPSGIYYIVAYADDEPAPLGVIDETNRENDNARAIALNFPSATPFGGGCAGGGGGGGGGAAWALPLIGALLVLGALAGRRSGARYARRGVPVAVAIIALAAATAGCARGGPLAAEGAGSRLGEGLVAALPDASPAARLLAAPPGGVGSRPIGIRAGIAMPIGEDLSEYNGSIMFGGFYPGRLRRLFGLDDVPFEAGLDLVFADADDGTIESTMLVFRFDMLFSKWGALGSRPDLYAVGGYELVDSINNIYAAGTESEFVSGLNVGVGANWADSRWDARLTWTVLLGSDNAGGLLVFSGNRRF